MKNMVAEFGFGMLYLTVHGEEQDVEKTHVLFQNVAEQGHSIVYGKVQEAKEWYQVAVEQGHEKALKRMEKFYSDDVMQGDIEALYCLGLVHEKKRDIPAAISCYKVAAARNITLAQCRLAFMALDGKGQEKNLSEAIQLYESAANNGNEVAAFCLALLFTTGRGVEQNFEKAKVLYLKATERNHSIAYLMLALLHGTGRCVDENYEVGDWYRLACQFGAWGKTKIKRRKMELTDITRDRIKVNNWYRVTDVAECRNRSFRGMRICQMI